MRVVETAVAASCAIMSEDKNLNGSDLGASSRKSAELSHSPNSEPAESSVTCGGRLKFFKDGKLILELSNRKEGERESWIPVQKKNLWHPAAVANSTASLSASDDTSSVQLSPWQRDHCWKQSVPRRLRGGGGGCTFHMVPRTAALQARYAQRALLRRLRRRPYEPVQFAAAVAASNGHIRSKTVKNVSGSTTRLAFVIQRIWELVKSSPNVFSPRKRILRDLERVCVVADEPVKRQRPRPPAATSSGNSKGVSSYSITSLLGPREDESSYLRNLLHSPSPKASASETYSGTQPPYVYYPFQPSATQPPYYMTSSPSHSLWTPYPMSSLPRGAGGPYAGLVTPYPSSHFSYPWSSPQGCQLKRDDTSSDVPLNLSKHGNG